MTSVGPYRLDMQIGAGGFADVYRSTHPVLGVPVAIKLLHPGVAALPSVRERMLQEARLTLRLRHPGIVHMYDVGEDDGKLFLVMELLEPATLRAQIDRARPGTAEALELACSLAEALAYAHDQGVLHRDLKPENVLLRDGRHVLADFGLAQPLRPDDARITRPGSIMGTPAYMAPEQLQGRSADRRSDVYALGVMLFELLTGAAPFGYDPSSASFGNLNTPAPRLRELDARVPPALDKLVASMLAKDPAQRPPDMRSVVRALSSILRQAADGRLVLPDLVQAGAAEVSPPESLPLDPVDAQYERFKPVRNVLLGAFALLLVLCVALFVIDRWTSRQPARSAVEVLEIFPFSSPRSIVLGRNRFSIASVKIRPRGEQAVITGLIRNDTSELQSTIEIVAIGRDANGDELWRGADDARGYGFLPGDITPFEFLIDDGFVPVDPSAVEFQLRSENTTIESRPRLVPSKVTLERPGDGYMVSGVLRNGAQAVWMPSVNVVFFDSAGNVLSVDGANLYDYDTIAANSEITFTLDIQQLPEPPAALHVMGFALPAP